MRHKSSIALTLTSIATLCANQTSLAQQRVAVKSDDMREVFVTAGYSAAFGAATGVALLPFISGTVSQNMRIVAGGASIGFLLGSALSFYNISANIHAANTRPTGPEYSTDEDTRYSSNEHEPLGFAPTKCTAPTNALVVGCGNRLSLSWPDVQIAPNSVSVSMLNVRF